MLFIRCYVKYYDNVTLVKIRFEFELWFELDSVISKRVTVNIARHTNKNLKVDSCLPVFSFFTKKYNVKQ